MGRARIRSRRAKVGLGFGLMFELGLRDSSRCARLERVVQEAEGHGDRGSVCLSNGITLEGVAQEAEGHGDPGSVCLSKCAALEGVVQEAEGHGDPGVIQPAAVAVKQQEGREWDSDAEEQNAGDADHEDGGQLRPGVALLVHVLLPVAAAPGCLWDRHTDIQTQ
jgi:hypothetical protein